MSLQVCHSRLPAQPLSLTLKLIVFRFLFATSSIQRLEDRNHYQRKKTTIITTISDRSPSLYRPSHYRRHHHVHQDCRALRGLPLRLLQPCCGCLPRLWSARPRYQDKRSPRRLHVFKTLGQRFSIISAIFIPRFGLRKRQHKKRGAQRRRKFSSVMIAIFGMHGSSGGPQTITGRPLRLAMKKEDGNLP